MSKAVDDLMKLLADSLKSADSDDYDLMIIDETLPPTAPTETMADLWAHLELAVEETDLEQVFVALQIIILKELDQVTNAPDPNQNVIAALQASADHLAAAAMDYYVSTK
jgi:hypothetical protein